MADRIPARIYIGGEMTSAQALVMLTYARADGCDIDDREILDYIDDGNLYLSIPDAALGEFKQLEEFLRLNNTPYTRYSDGGESYDACVSFYRKGYGREFELNTTQDGEPVMPAHAAVEAFKALKHGNVHAALEALAPYENYEIPALPPFQLIDGVS